MNKDQISITKYLLLLPAGILLAALASLSASTVEFIYSQRLFAFVNPIISKMSGILPFSLAEILVLAFVLAAFRAVIGFIIKVAISRDKIKICKHGFLTTLAIISILYFAFNLLWGCNYYRLPFADIAGLEIRQPAAGELEELCRLLVLRANHLRTLVSEDSEGIMQLRKGRKDVYQSASDGFVQAAELYPQLGGSYGPPKPVFLSGLMSYAGISGIYFPFTAEANVNNRIPDYLLPATATHELAHQRGYAREDEANYIAYLTCRLHSNPDFQYSGTLLALIYSINALYEQNPALALEIKKDYSDALRRDTLHWGRFWQQYAGPVEKISREVNDTYLKANRQQDGVKSYDRMVSLLLAEFRQGKRQ